jgi:hypothetical protein
MRIRLNNPSLLPDLVAFLEGRFDAVVTELADDELEVNLMGSYGHEAMQMELYLRIRAWEAARGATGVAEIVG